MFAAGFSWYQLIPSVAHDELLAPLGVHGHNYIFVAGWLVCAVLIVLALVARRSLDKARARTGIERYFADDKLTPRNTAEVFAEGAFGIMGDVLTREDVRKFFPLIASVFAYIFAANLSGMVPGFLPPTDNVNTNVGMAVIIFLVFNAVGILRDPAGYFKHLWGPVFVIGFLLFPVEVFGLILRPVTLSLRLTGNMFGDHTVFAVMSDLVPWGVPAAFLGLALFVSFMQAFIFSLLSTVYIGLAVPHHDDEH